MITFSQPQQWRTVQSHHIIKLNKTLRRCFQESSVIHLRHFRPAKVQQMYRTVQCKSGLSDDAPFAIAIGTCVLNSVIFPARDKEDEDEETMEDIRLAAMGIISFIPFFNWLSWVFEWLDTGRQRYLIYAIVYLAPYIRSKLSISPEDSWLPIASILVGILHIQLEISLKSGELKDFQLFGDASTFFSDRSGGNKFQKQLHSMLQKLQESEIEREGKKEESLEPPLVEEETNRKQEWDEKMKSLLEDQQPREENPPGNKNINKKRNGLSKSDDCDAF